MIRRNEEDGREILAEGLIEAGAGAGIERRWG